MARATVHDLHATIHVNSDGPGTDGDGLFKLTNRGKTLSGHCDDDEPQVYCEPEDEDDGDNEVAAE